MKDGSSKPPQPWCGACQELWPWGIGKAGTLVVEGTALVKAGSRAMGEHALHNASTTIFTQKEAAPNAPIQKLKKKV